MAVVAGKIPKTCFSRRRTFTNGALRMFRHRGIIPWGEEVDWLGTKRESCMLRPCCAEQMVAPGNPLIPLRLAVNALQHEIDRKNEAETGTNP
jgi:hypothetical protein